MARTQSKAIDALVYIGAVCWIILIITAWIATPLSGFIGTIFGAILMMTYFVMGTERLGKLNLKPVPFLYPILIQTFFWILSFIIAYSMKEQPAQTFILGLHPSAFWPLLLFWIGGLLTGTLSYFIFFDKYLPDSDWEEFMKEVEKNKNSNFRYKSK